MALRFCSKQYIGMMAFVLGLLLSGCHSYAIGSKTSAGRNGILDSICSNGLCALIFLSAECPICQNQVLTLNQLMKKYPDVQFRGVFTAWDKQRDIATFQRSFAPAFPLSRDKHHHLAKRLGATVTPEVFLLHNRRVVYQGAIDNWYYAPGRHRVAPTLHYLEAAIRAVQNGRAVDPAKTEAIGCLMEF